MTADVIINADQSELEALFNTVAPLDAGLNDNKQASALDTIDLVGSINNGWSERDYEIDNIGSELTTELSSRYQLLGSGYPFLIEGSGLKLNIDRPNLFYIFCLIISHSKIKAHAGEKANNLKMARLFEKVTLKIIQKSLGTFSNSLHFGFPRDDRSNIFKAMENLKNQLDLSGEFKPNPIDYVEEDLMKQKDLGIDQIIWIKRPDQRKYGHLFLLGQCACGQDYLNKFNDINLNKLNNYFRPLTHVSPIKAMSVPFLVSEKEFRRISNEAGWLFDRISLSALYDSYEDLKVEYDYQLLDSIAQSTPHGIRFKHSLLYEMLTSKCCLPEIEKDIKEFSK
ncbi:hypothetical protein VXS12_16775 [Acinetobacter baumannii]|uniref:none n=1 Tax=Acinetobacter baumannii TaxID=470 RepID=UPI002E17E72E|nr:hypothetical protein [Acinetobacter baumannii]